MMEEQRLQKYIASCGFASRRKAEEIIATGRVTVDGMKVVSPGTKVGPDSVVLVDGKKLELVKSKIYIMLNKPSGYICSSDAQFGRKSVLEILSGINERLFTIGRLDYNTTGLLLITNDGLFAQILSHPQNRIDKEYVATVAGHPAESTINMLREGIILEGRKTDTVLIEKISESTDTATYSVILHEGRKRQIRMMFALSGYPVKNLKRIAYGKFTIGDLEEGQWRHLTNEEVDMVLSGLAKK
jgi:23S rRNA pseudouridine2605 synthase